MKTNKTSISFVAHKGLLEIQAVLLAASLRYYNGDKYCLYACVPEEQGGIESGVTEETKFYLKKLNVNLVEVKNHIGSDYMIGNKLECLDCNNHPYRVFLDTDMLCCSSIKFPEIKSRSIALKPADRNTCTWDEDMWSLAYSKYSESTLEQEDYVVSTAFREKMRPYFNAGMIAINQFEGLSSTWIEIAKKLDVDNDFTHKRPWLDQLALPLAIKKEELKVTCLTEYYNLPANIKPVLKDEGIVHYHKPDIVARNSILIKCLKKIVKKYSWVLSHLKSSDEWKKVHQVLMLSNINNYFNPPKKPNQNIIITGLPRSGTSYFCTLLSQIKNHIVINEPVEISRPLKKRYIPWGVLGYYSNIRRDITLGEPILNKQKKGKLIEDTATNDVRNLYFPEYSNINFTLATKNTIRYITALSRLLTVMPEAKYIALFRSPVDTIASWNNSFLHLKEARPSKINVLKQNSVWLSVEDRIMLDEIDKFESRIMRQAMLWNFFAQQLINFRCSIELIKYDSIVTNPSPYFSYLTGRKEVNLKQSKVRSKRHLLSNSDIKTIENITSQTYSDLCDYEFKIPAKV
jgi:hypothetical protein